MRHATTTHQECRRPAAAAASAAPLPAAAARHVSVAFNAEERHRWNQKRVLAEKREVPRDGETRVPRSVGIIGGWDRETRVPRSLCFAFRRGAVGRARGRVHCDCCCC